MNKDDIQITYEKMIAENTLTFCRELLKVTHGLENKIRRCMTQLEHEPYEDIYAVYDEVRFAAADASRRYNTLQYVLQNQTGISEVEHSLSEHYGIAYKLCGTRIIIKTPLLPTKHTPVSKRGQIEKLFLMGNTIYCPEVQVLVKKLLLEHKVSETLWVKKAVHFLFVNKDSNAPDPENYDIRSILNAVTSYSAYGDAAGACRIITEAGKTSSLEEGTYIVLQEHDDRLLSDKEIAALWNA